MKVTPPLPLNKLGGFLTTFCHLKHSLRGENGVFYEDLYPLICYLPRYATDASIKPDPEDSLPLWDNVTHSRAPVVPPFGVDSLKNESETPNGPQRRGTIFQPEQALPRVSTDVPLLPARIPPRTTFYDYLPIFLFFKPILTIFRGTRYTEDRRDGAGRKKAARPVESNVPLEISLFLSSYAAWLLKEDLVKPAIATALINTLTVLQDTVANLDRVRTTPIPFAYQAHLRTTMWYVYQRIEFFTSSPSNGMMTVWSGQDLSVLTPCMNLFLERGP